MSVLVDTSVSTESRPRLIFRWTKVVVVAAHGPRLDADAAQVERGAVLYHRVRERDRQHEPREHRRGVQPEPLPPNASSTERAPAGICSGMNGVRR
jgi:hypothetical protein